MFSDGLLIKVRNYLKKADLVQLDQISFSFVINLYLLERHPRIIERSTTADRFT